jgi:hypothetical protein
MTAGIAAESEHRTEGGVVPEINDARKLFVPQVGEALNMERTVLTMLKKNEEAAQKPELKRLFEHHRDETEGQNSTRSKRSSGRLSASRSGCHSQSRADDAHEGAGRGA